jgi:hypothetical protein
MVKTLRAAHAFVGTHSAELFIRNVADTVFNGFSRQFIVQVHQDSCHIHPKALTICSRAQKPLRRFVNLSTQHIAATVCNRSTQEALVSGHLAAAQRAQFQSLLSIYRQQAHKGLQVYTTCS